MDTWSAIKLIKVLLLLLLIKTRTCRSECCDGMQWEMTSNLVVIEELSIPGKKLFIKCFIINRKFGSFYTLIGSQPHRLYNIKSTVLKIKTSFFLNNSKDDNQSEIFCFLIQQRCCSFRPHLVTLRTDSSSSCWPYYTVPFVHIIWTLTKVQCGSLYVCILWGLIIITLLLYLHDVICFIFFLLLLDPAATRFCTFVRQLW